MIGKRKILGLRREFRESFEKKMNSEEMGGIDETVLRARDFERYNVNL